MRVRTAIVAGVLLVTSGCTGDAGDAGVAATAGTDADNDAGTSDAATYDTADPAVADAVFLTAVDGVLEGTVHAGLVDEQPGELLATADAICQRLDEGAEPHELVAAYLDALAEASGGTASADDGALAGALLGAGVEVFCPQHVERVTGEEQP